MFYVTIVVWRKKSRVFMDYIYTILGSVQL